LNSPSVKVPLTRGNSFNFKTVQGSFASVNFTGTGEALQSFNLPSRSGTYIDQFYVNVLVNDNPWKKYSSLYDIPLEKEGYLVKSGISEGIDLYFGNSNFCRIPQRGSLKTVQFLQNSGYAGNLRSSADSPLTFRFLDSGTDLFGNEVNLNNFLKITNVIDPSFGADPEPISLIRIMAPKTSRSFVFANAENYEIFLQKFNIFSQIQAFSTFDDEYLDDDNVVYIFLVPDVTIGLTSNQDYFDIPQTEFLLTDSQKIAILNLIEDSGQMIATTVVKILQPEITKFVVNVILSIFEGYDPEIIKDQIRQITSGYFLNLKRRDRIPRSDLIALVESIEGVDSVAVYFIGEDNEAYHATVDDLPNASEAQKNRQIGLDNFGDIIIGRGELILIRGGWEDRYGVAYEDSIVPGKPSALNIQITSVNPMDFLAELNMETKARLIASNN
jgi:hypothetical protein